MHVNNAALRPFAKQYTLLTSKSLTLVYRLLHEVVLEILIPVLIARGNDLLFRMQIIIGMILLPRQFLSLLRDSSLLFLLHTSIAIVLNGLGLGHTLSLRPA